MKDGMSDAEGRALGLSVYDIAQAKEQFEKGTGTILGDSVNKAKANKEAAAKAARERRKKKEQKEKIDKKNKEARERDPSKGTTGNFAGTETI